MTQTQPRRRMLMWFPWCTSEYRLSFCKEKVAELRAAGRKARYRKTGAELMKDPETGRLAMTPYGRIYILREEART